MRKGLMLKIAGGLGGIALLAGMLTGSASAAPGNGVTTFNVYYSGSSLPSSGDQVTVKAPTGKTPDDQTFLETCTKPNDPDHCKGSSHNYHRAGAGFPWYVD